MQQGPGHRLQGCLEFIRPRDKGVGFKASASENKQTPQAVSSQRECRRGDDVKRDLSPWHSEKTSLKFSWTLTAGSGGGGLL